MITWFVTSTLLTTLALLFIYTNTTSPHRLRFLVSIAALCTWLIPWQLIGKVVPATPIHEFAQVQQTFTTTLQNMNELSSGPTFDILNATNSQGSVIAAVILALTIASFCGIAVFILNLYQHNLFLNNLAATSKPGNQLLKSFPGAIPRALNISKVKILIQDQVPGAMCTGMLSHTIWIHENLIEDDRLPAVLLHELNHVMQKDNYYLLIIAFIEKIFWWNPLIALTAKQSRKLQEFSCDEECAEWMPNYRRVLSSLILDHTDRDSAFNKGKLSLNILKDHNFNVVRIKHLERRYTMKLKHVFNLVLTCCAAFLTVSLVTAQTGEFSQADFEQDALMAVGGGGQSVNGEISNIAFMVKINQNAEFSMYYPDTHLITLLTTMVDMQSQLKVRRNIDKATGEERPDPNYERRLEVIERLDIGRREIIDKDAYGVALPPGRFDNLSLQATLSLLAEQSQCSITKEGNAIVVDNCSE